MPDPANWPAELEYVGFWARVGAALIDSVLLLAIITPLLYWFYGPSYFLEGDAVHGLADVLLNWVLPAVAVIVFWVYRQATPGKMVIKARIVDADTGATAVDRPADRPLLRLLHLHHPALPRPLLGRIRCPQAGLARQARPDRRGARPSNRHD